MTYGLKIPTLFSDLLQSSEHQRLVELYLSTFDEWYTKNDTPFFREYTDHGPKHVQTVLETAAGLITQATKERFSDSDAAVLICATILHDVALHFQHHSFIALISDQNTPPGHQDFDDETWAKLWKDFISESSRLSDEEKITAFGTNDFFDPPDLSDSEGWSKLQERYIGEFLRRHHPRIAYEIPNTGIPGSSGVLPIDSIRKDDSLYDFSQLSGLVARSHGLPLRALIEPLQREFNKRVYKSNCHPIYLMVLLRIADYLQLQASRALDSRLKVMRLKSPMSVSEWGLHDAVRSIDFEVHDDPEVVFVQINPRRTDIDVYLKVEKLISNLQNELDTSWAVLGEIYGRFQEKDLGISIRRIRSNIEDKFTFGKQAGFIPQDVRFSAANSELTKLLIKPLYGDYPEIAVRELVQNAVDACRERAFLESKNGKINPDDYQVTVSIIRNQNSSYSLIVEDTGIGMSMEILKNYFLNAGASFRSALAWKKNFTDDKRKSQILRSGKFGVGALAAFLVADDPSDVRIKVHTRRYDEPPASALTFEASLSEKPISVDFHEKGKLGTCIEVITKNPPTFMKTKNSKKDKDEKYETWDWYCLSWPKVNRITQDGTKLDQKYVLPADQENYQSDYYWLDAPNFSGVGWTFEKAPALVCNGIKVIDEQSYQNRAPDLVKEDSLFGQVTIPMPNLSVFDKNGLLPLTLDRLRIDYDQLSFLGQLRETVLNNIVGALLIAAPQSVEPNEFELSNKIIDHFFSNINGLTSKNIGWVVSDGETGIYCSSTISNFINRRVFEFYSSQDLELVDGAKRKEIVFVNSKKCIFNAVLSEKTRGCYYGVLQDRSSMERIEERMHRLEHEFERFDNLKFYDEHYLRNNRDEFKSFFETLNREMHGILKRKNYVDDYDIERFQEKLRNLLEESRNAPHRHMFDELFHFLENFLHSRFDTGPVIHHVLRLLDRKFRHEIVPNQSDARLILDIFEAAIESKPELKSYSHPEYKTKDSLINRNKIVKPRGDENWFVSEWFVPENIEDDKSTISRVWNNFVPNKLVSQCMKSRIQTFSGLERKKLNLEEWLNKRNLFVSQKKR